MICTDFSWTAQQITSPLHYTISHVKLSEYDSAGGAPVLKFGKKFGNTFCRRSVRARSSKSHWFWPFCTGKCLLISIFYFIIFFWGGGEGGGNGCFFSLGRFLKKLAYSQWFTIYKNSIYHIKYIIASLYHESGLTWNWTFNGHLYYVWYLHIPHFYFAGQNRPSV